MKRPLDETSPEDDEEQAEGELTAAIAAAARAPPDEDIAGLGSGTAMVAFDVKGEMPKQYKVGRKNGEKSLVFIYLCIRGLGETPRLMLAECGAEHLHLASPMGEDQAVACEWRKRSPNGLTPLLSGLGVPRSQPLSQSGAIVRFLARRFGMAGASELEEARADTLYETAKDLKGKKAEITGGSAAQATAGPKGPVDTARCIAAMLEAMPDAADENAALNFGQMELLCTLFECEEAATGCVKQLHPALEAFRAAGASRPRIARYLASPMRFPSILPGYQYAKGPVKRAAFAL